MVYSSGAGLQDTVVSQDDNDIALDAQAGRGAVEADIAVAFLPFDSVGGKARAVIDVQHVHLLVRENIGGTQEFLIDGDAAFVVDIGVSDARPGGFCS